MAALILPSRRVVQPQGPVEVDWSNPLTKGLFAASPGYGTGYGFAPVSGISRKTTQSGFAISAPGSVAYNPALKASVTSNEWTLFSKSSNSVASGFSSAFGIYGSSSERITQMFRAFSSGTFGCDARPYKVDDDALFALVAGKEYSLATVISVSRNALEHYVDGVLVLSNTLDSTSSITVSSLEIFSKNLTGDIAPAESTVGVFGAFSRSLTAAEVRALSQNPWQLFRPIQRRIWVAVAAGATIITASQPGSWSVRNNVNASQPGSWSIRNLAAASQAASWSVRNFATASQPGAFSVRNFITASQPSSWSVRNFATASQPGSWSVASNVILVTASQAGAWSVRNLVAAAQASSWVVRNYRGASQSGAWSVGSYAAFTRAPSGSGYSVTAQTISRPDRLQSSGRPATKNTRRP